MGIYFSITMLKIMKLVSPVDKRVVDQAHRNIEKRTSHELYFQCSEWPGNETNSRQDKRLQLAISYRSLRECLLSHVDPRFVRLSGSVISRPIDMGWLP